MTERTVNKLSDDSVISTETFSYDAACNITDAPNSCFRYDTNNRLISFNGNSISYDLDGNMLTNGSLTCAYDSAKIASDAIGIAIGIGAGLIYDYIVGPWLEDLF